LCLPKTVARVRRRFAGDLYGTFPAMPPQNGTSAAGESRRWDRLHIWQIQAVRDLLVIAAVFGLVYAGYAMRTVTTPLLIALALAYLFEPFVAWSTQRLHVRRPFVVGGLLAVLVTGATVTLILTVPLAVRQTVSLMEDVRSGRLLQAVVNAEHGLPEPMREPFRGFLEMSGMLEAKERAARAAEQRDAAQRAPDDEAPDGSEDEPAAEGLEHSDARTAVGEAIDEDEPSVITAMAEAIAEEAARRGDAAGDPDGEVAKPQAGRDDPGAVGEPGVRPAPADREGIRLADLDRDNGRPLFGALFDVESDEERIRRIVREELAASPLSPTATTSGPTRWLNFVHRGVSTAWSILGTAIAISLLLFLIPFYFFFFSLWWPTVTGFLAGLIPNQQRERSFELLGQMDRAVAGFVRGRVVISAIVAVILGVGWYSIGVPYSIVLALAVGVFNLVPYLCGIGLPVAIGLLAMDQLGVPAEYRQGWLWITLAPTVVFVIAQFLDGYILTPLIAGKATDLDPVTIVVAIIAGGTIAGIYGMLIAIPAAACLKILLREVVLPKVKAWTRGEAADPLPIKE